MTFAGIVLLLTILEKLPGTVVLFITTIIVPFGTATFSFVGKNVFLNNSILFFSISSGV